VNIPSATLKSLLKKCAPAKAEDLFLDTAAGLLVAYDHDLTILVHSPSLVGEGYQVLIPARKLTTVVNRMSGVIGIEAVGKTLVLKSARATIEIETKPSKKQTPLVFSETLSLPLGTVKSMLAFAAISADTNKASDYGGVVKFQSKVLSYDAGKPKYGMQAAGTEGHRLFIAEESTDMDLGFSYTIPLPAVAAIQTLEGETLEVAETDSVLFLRAGDVSIYAAKLSKAFPNYDNFIPKEFKATYSVDAEQFKGVLRMIQPMLDPEKLNASSVHFLDGLVTVSAPGAKDAIEYKQLLPDPIFEDTINSSVLFNGEYLLSYFGAVSGSVDISVGGKNAPLWVVCGNRKMLLGAVPS
jgi:DNA polymerase III sliding clamp (beta) subunit (PCNA family)